MLNALEEIRNISSGLRASGIGEPEKEAEMILTGILGINKTVLYRDNPALSPAQEEAIRQVVRRRTLREPFHYIAGRVDFCGLSLEIGTGVLIPRPETELLVEEAVKSAKSLCFVFRGRPLKILDLCTGSGCVALAMARSLPDAEITGIDISPEAIGYAVINAGRNDIRNVTFHVGDLYEPVKKEIFDVIVSNPPYIKRGQMSNLQPEILQWEPSAALDGGQDGLDFYRRIIFSSLSCIGKGGALVLELGYDLKDAVQEIAKRAGYQDLFFRKDYAGLDRVLCARKI